MFWKKERKPLSLVCDIGSAHVGLGLVDKTQTIPTIISFVRVPLTIADTFNQASLEIKIVSFFEQALEDLERSLKVNSTASFSKNVDSAHLIFSSPWYVSRTKNVVFEKDDDFVLDQHTLESLMDEEEKKFETEALRGEFPTLVDRDIHMIERELIRIKLNGYDTPNPFMKRAKHVELTLYMSLVPHILLEQISNVIKKRFHTDDIKASTFPVVSFSSIGQLFPAETEYLVFDISGEATDVSFVIKNSIRGSTSFPSGRNGLIRVVAEKFGVSPEIALSFLSLYTSDTLEESMKVTMSELLKEIMPRWIDQVKSSIETIASYDKGDSLRAFITLHNDTGPIFIDSLKKVVDPVAIDTFALSTDFIGDRVSYGKYVEKDAFIALETFYLNSKKLFS